MLTSLLDDTYGLNSLANNLLEIARSEQDISALKLTSVRLDELLLLSQAEINAIHPDYTIETEITEAPDNDEHDLAIIGNENLLKLIFINLIDNACKFSEGGVVKASLGFFPEHVLITIKDTGIGIDSDDLQHIFEPFYRAKNAANLKGHGIGLSLIQKIVKLHKGDIQIESRKGEGTTVRVSLPYSL